MKINSVVEINVLDKCKTSYDFPILDESGKETGRNTGETYYITAKPSEGLPCNIKLSSSMAQKFEDIKIGVNQFILEVELQPRAYVDKKGKAQINFMDVPTIADIVPYKK